MSIRSFFTNRRTGVVSALAAGLSLAALLGVTACEEVRQAGRFRGEWVLTSRNGVPMPITLAPGTILTEYRFNIKNGRSISILETRTVDGVPSTTTKKGSWEKYENDILILVPGPGRCGAGLEGTTEVMNCTIGTGHRFVRPGAP